MDDGAGGRKMKNTIRTMLAGLLFLGLCAVDLLTCRAAGTKVQMLMQMESDTAVYEEAKEDSAVVSTIPKGTAVICAETDSAQWYEVTYQEVKGFVQAKALGAYGDEEELTEEFEEIHEDNSAHLEAVEESRQQKKSQLFWGGIMAVLVVLMFAVGIFTALRSKDRTGAGKTDRKTTGR